MTGGMAGMTWMMVIWPALGVALLTLTVCGIVALVRNLSRPTHHLPQDRTPEHELRHRYVRGEIDHEDYRQRLDDLRSG